MPDNLWAYIKKNIQIKPFDSDNLSAYIKTKHYANMIDKYYIFNIKQKIEI